MATNLPRFLAGDTSATYMGESTEAAPTANPPKSRAEMNPNEVVARAVAAQESAKNKATIICKGMCITRKISVLKRDLKNWAS